MQDSTEDIPESTELRPGLITKPETSIAVVRRGVYEFLSLHWGLAIDRVLRFLARRRRHATLRFAVAATGTFIFVAYCLWAVLISRRKIPPEVKQLREKASLENTDEFLVSVLNELTFHEVDLYAKAGENYDECDEEIEKDRRRIVDGLGEGGAAATIPPSLNATAEEVMKKEGFNRVLGDMISLTRSTRDARPPACQSEVYDTVLPVMTVVIVFCDEAFSNIVRTVHSVFSRTPPQFLKDIVLIDDFSGKKDLKGKLERYLATKFDLDKIRLIRLETRSGLIRARMMGAHFATGDVVVFLDAHCETTVEWAEPILQRIKENRKAVVTPVIDGIDDKTMEFHADAGEVQIGGFSWSGGFTWINVPEREKKRRRNKHRPTRSPTMAGGLFALDRKFFWEIGSYDPDMTFWGAENLEISFRIWMCGGVLETIPCSRVGHIYKSGQPWSTPKGVDFNGVNAARLAEVWMDEYKELFYFYMSHMKHKRIGDITRRLAFRKRKKCKSFQWFLDNIYKEKYKLWMDAHFYGQFKNPKSNECLDDLQTQHDEYTLSTYTCHKKMHKTQIFSISKQGELRKEDVCARAESGEKTVWMASCDEKRKNDQWIFKSDTGQLVHKKSKKCLTVREGEDDKNGTLFLEPCEEGGLNEDSLQRWTVDSHEGEDDDDDEDETEDAEESDEE